MVFFLKQKFHIYKNMERQTSLSSKKRELTLELPPEHQTEEVVTIRINGKDWDFSPAMVKRWPKLLHPDTRYLLKIESLIPILYGYDPACIPEDLLDDPSEKQTFLHNANWLEVQLSDQTILHLSKQLKKDVQEAASIVKQIEGSKGRDKARILYSKPVLEFVSQFDDRFRELQADITPQEVLSYLSIASESFIDKIVLNDFKSNNEIMKFIRSFIQKFRG